MHCSKVAFEPTLYFQLRGEHTPKGEGEKNYVPLLAKIKMRQEQT
jgi:hypothetical protein